METFSIKIINNGKTITSSVKVSCEEIYNRYKDEIKFPCYLAKVNNAYRGLNHLLWHDCEVEFLDIRNQACWQVYQNSLVLLFNKACKDILGDDCLVSVQNSLNKGLYLLLNKRFTYEHIIAIKERMFEICAQNVPITKHHLSKEEAINLATRLQHNETIDLLNTIEKVDDVQVYSLENEMEFLFSQSVPSTSYLNKFDLEIYEKGIILKFPHPEDPLTVCKTNEQPILYEAFKESNKWGKLLGVKYIRDVNKAVDDEKINDLILMQEGLHEKRIAEIAEDISKNKKRVVLICGPSSSGKTTFAKRLCNQLNIIGVKTLYIGTDDYFLDEKDKPLDENGEVDLETIKAVDVKLFIENLKDLLSGKTVDMPIFDFIQCKKIFGRKITKLENKQILVIEGIHTLNKLMTEGIDEKEKYKIYISPFTPVGIDHHNRISTTDARMLRRLVRDYQFRGRTPEKVLNEWAKVRKSENVNIFPFHIEADTFFNSNCIYELPVLKKFAWPLLKEIDREQPEYAEAQKMIEFLKFIDEIKDPSIIPNTSIMREFIGGSAFVK